MALKIIFMGTPDFAVPILKAIHESDHTILEVYTQPPTRSGRGQKINHSNIHNYSEQLNLKVRCPTALETNEEINHIKKLNPNVVVVVAYGKIIPTEMLNIDNILFINVHASLLPRWRGAAPIQRAIMNMDNETGISIMKIEPKLDSGPVMLQSKIKIHPNFNCEELSKEMSILVNNWFMMYFLTVILIGTIYPIFLEVINSEKISVGPPFYNKLIIPFLVPFLFGMAIGPKLKWVKSDFKNKLYLVIFLITSFLLSALIVKNFNISFLINTILVTSAFYLFFITLRDFLIKRFNNFSQNISHFGFSLLILSILLNNIFSASFVVVNFI